VAVTSADDTRVRCLAYRTSGATLLWLANTTADEQAVRVDHRGAKAIGIVLDETSFVQATTEPLRFRSQPRPLDLRRLTLRAYAVALVCIADA
jgi:hypothetical protein